MPSIQVVPFSCMKHRLAKLNAYSVLVLLLNFTIEYNFNAFKPLEWNHRALLSRIWYVLEQGLRFDRQQNLLLHVHLTYHIDEWMVIAR